MNIINGEIMKDNILLYTDLAYEKSKFKEEDILIDENNNVEVVRNKHYTTIFYNDIMSRNSFEIVCDIFIKELKKYLDNITNKKILVVGLGNTNSTPDSLGPMTISKILVTGHLSSKKGYSNVYCFSPNVKANTGLDSSRIIKSLVRDIKADKLIIIDALKTNNMNRLAKTIQITDKGISPGSGINSNRLEISKKLVGCDVVAIGIPTVVDIKTLLKENDNYIVTPTNIDYLVERLSSLLANGLNSSLHKNFIRQNNL